MASYHEKLIASVEINLSDFQEKMKAADLAVQTIAKTTDRRVEVISKSFSNTGNTMINAAIEAMDEFAQEVMGDSIFECPEDTGVLVRSARVEGATKVAKRIKVKMGYGYGDEINPDTKRTADQYAWPVHEIYDAEHEPPTKDHFLIDPLLEHARTYGTDLAAAMRNSVEGTYEQHLIRGRSVELNVGSSVETEVAAIGGGVASRGGNPANLGQFSKRSKK